MKKYPVSEKPSKYSSPQNIPLVFIAMYNSFIVSNLVLAKRVCIEVSLCD